MTQSKPLFPAKVDVYTVVNDAIERARRKLGEPRLWPVKRKVYKMIHGRLLTLQSSLPESSKQLSDKDQRLNGRIAETLQLFDDSITEDAAWDVADSLKELLPELAPAEFIYRALVEEKGRETNDPHGWERYYPLEDLNRFIADYEKDAEKFERQKAAERLIALYKIRNDWGRHNRAREGVRWRYLLWLSLLLLPASLLALFWETVSNSQNQTAQMGVVLVAGAVGAVLSRTIRLRDLGRIVELKGAWKTLIPQMILGATLAMIVVLILRTGAIKIGSIDIQGADVNVLFVVGLISGFSEPFALGILEKIAALGK